MKSKAQTQQVFVFILVALVVGLVLFVGMKGVNSLLGKGCEAEMVDFTTSLNRYIDRYSDFGTVKTESLRAPCDYSRLYFISSNALGSSPQTGSELIDGSVEEGVLQNVFLEKGDGTVEPISYYEEIVLEQSFLMIESVNSRFTVKFIGRGRSIDIKQG